MNRLHILLSALGAAALATSLAACGDETTCGTGTVDENGTCVPEATCGTGTTLTDGQCVPDGSVVCEQGTRFDTATGTCIVDPSACAAGTVLVDGECIPEDETLEDQADHVEAAEPNDPGDGLAGEFNLPALNASTTIYGCIDPYRDDDNSGNDDADLDTWIITATGPAVVEITADGIRGLSAGFIAINADGNPALANWQRIGINLTGDTSKRQIYLPAAGDYGLIMADTRPLFLGGEAAGGPESCYFATIKNVPLPATTALAFPTTTGMDDGNVKIFTHTPDAVGDIVDVNFASPSATISPAFIVNRGGALAASVVSQDDGLGGSVPPFKTIGGLNANETVQVVVDFEYNFGTEPQPYAFTSYDISAQPLDVTGTAVTVTRKNTLTPIGFPYPDFNYLYFDVAAPTVVHFDLTTSADVNFVITRRDIFTDAGGLDAMAAYTGLNDEFDVVTTFQDEFVRFRAPGRYYVITYDPAPDAVRGSTYTVTTTNTNVPVTAATFGTPLASQNLSALGVGYHTVDLNNPIWIETGVTATNFGGNVRVKAYDEAYDGWLGGAATGNMVFTAIGGAQQPNTGATPTPYIAARDTRDVFLEISDVGTSAANPSYTLTVQNRPHVNLQMITAGTPITRTGMDNIAAGGVQRFIVFGGLSNRLAATLTPANAAADITINQYTSRTEALGTPVNAAGAGAAETLNAVFPGRPSDFVAFQVTSATATGVDSNDTAVAPRLYTSANGTLTMTDACTGTGSSTIMTDQDDSVSGNQTLPAFLSGLQLFGDTVGAVPFRVSSNGVMAFNVTATALSGTAYGQVLPTAGGTNGIIAPYWDDLDHTTICRKDDATANTMTLQWTGNVYGLTHLRVAVQVVFHMNGAIDIIYGSGQTADGSSAYVGLENVTGLIGSMLSNNAPGFTVAGRSVTLTPQ